MSRISALFLFFLLAAAAVIATAQQRPGRRSPMYDPKTEVTVAGTVDDVQNQGCVRNGCCMSKQGGMHLILQSESEKVEVCVGPANFVQQKGFTFAKADTIEVVGSKVKMAGKGVVVARQITKDKQALTLRDSQGIPAWGRGPTS
jgi:hypothetical protein